MIQITGRQLHSLKIDEQQFKDMMYANERTITVSKEIQQPARNHYLAVYYGEDDMNIFVFGVWNKDGDTVVLENPIVSIIDGVYNFYDYDVHKWFALMKGITTGYRRRPKNNAPTNYNVNETYEYNGKPITRDIRNRLAEKFGMYDFYRLKSPGVVHECNKCHKKNKEL